VEDGSRPSHRAAHCGDGPFRQNGYYIAPFRKKDVSHHQNAWARQEEQIAQRMAEIKVRSLTPAKSMNAFQSFENAKATMAKDVAALNFEGSTVVARHRLISIDLLTGKLKARTAPDAKVSCYINLPTTAGEELARRLEQVIMNPKLAVCLLSFDAWDDLTSTLWAYTNTDWRNICRVWRASNSHPKPPNYSHRGFRITESFRGTRASAAVGEPSGPLYYQ
jgi:hypothetical protein